jgi:tRNA(fMet)-specific endonuclease VapC
MTLGSHELIALDTNVLVHWVRQDSMGKHLMNAYSLEQRAERPLVSTIVEGEVRGLAMCWKWGPAKVTRLDEILAELVRVEAGHPDIVHAYAGLYFEDQSRGTNTGENDLWIAATAKATAAVLLTSDKDFGWMSPGLVRIELVAIV